MVYINKEEWQPKQGIVLEEQAYEIVKCEENSRVLAGPGAGKTELLGQRASYLLETNTCRNPKKILAISFKKDSATNLQERVKQRCGIELASRFESKTFESFAKNLVDRFGNGLPNYLKPSADYIIKFINPRDVRELFDCMGNPENYPWERISYRDFAMNHASESLPLLKQDVNSLESYYKYRIWSYLIKEQTKSELTFPMISRLAEYLMRSNPKLVFALQETYSHVFLDEFQDTTSLQYDLFKTCFKGSNVKVTAVGDIKQRIMGWAGAMPEAFSYFGKDFHSENYELILNHRSTKKLIDIQSSIVEDILGVNPETEYPTYKAETKNSDCKVFIYENEIDEAESVANLIDYKLESENLQPRDICILVRMLPDRYSETVISELNSKNIHSRIENKWQDLLAENCMPLILNCLRLAIHERDPDSWSDLLSFLKYVNGAYDSEEYKLEISAHQFLQKLKESILSEIQTRDLIWEIINFVGIDHLKDNFPEYFQGDYLERVINETSSFLDLSLNRQGGKWKEALDDFLGLNSIPIMSIHKSKGLEFECVIFLGLEDDAFRNYTENKTEEDYTFFVALSRAKKDFYITFNSGRFGGQQRINISPIYQMIDNAGVDIVKGT
ncbi:UvrD-helicase domain-containing protein [Halobacillus amylolyticus]|uniref:DNA 3'-5' helicase n=1 Tax=Halobacillus amylolyticus TaxID=2932259 RepID=A0ABY4H727_9BACI|nr:ATP-dependent helicase [Halobacillus amylolyticus]UOR10287.1 ATP-dependent helicase [Halobacillus amylolyticus]